MAHVLILGMTLSGKTHKAKQLARDYKRAGVGVLVLDPLCDPEWNADFITADQDEFLNVFWNSRSCMAFMDEGGESVGRYNVAMSQTATRGRHWGHTCHYLAQKGTQLAPLVRDQCTRLFLFCSGSKDGAVLAQEWNRPELENCTQLKQGEYYYAVKMGSISTNRSNSNGTISDRDGTSDDRGGSARKPRAGKTGVREKGGAETGEAVGGRTIESGGVSD